MKLFKNLRIKAIPDLPEHDPDPNLIHELLYKLDRSIAVDNAYIIAAITPAKAVIDGRYDCMDFRMGTMLRIMCVHGDKLQSLSPTGVQMIKEAFLNAKFWMTEPGEDSMCYWSENHQLLFAVAEYLAGQCWPDEIFTNDGSTGRERMARGRARIAHWARQRWNFGYSEFNSTNYYLYNVGPASNFIQFCAPEDKPLAQQLRMCLDLLFFDVACFMHKFSFIAPTGRAYVNNMVGITGDSVHKAVRHLWNLDDQAQESDHSQLINFFAMLRARDENGKPYYELPQVLRVIGLDTSPRVLKASFSVDTAELPGLGLVGHGDAQIMRQLSMEAFTNPELFHNTATYLVANNMLSNKFVNQFKIATLPVLRNRVVLNKLISGKLKPMPNGIAIQRANLVCRQTPHYALSSLQRYHPGGFGAQQMLNCANFGGNSVVFTAHPARHEDENTVGGYPGYWAGFGRAPHSVQHEDVLMLMYRLPKRSGFLELYQVPQFTHTYLPEAFFDEVLVQGRHAFARLSDGFLALTGAMDLEYLPWSEHSAKAFKNGMDELRGKRFDLVQHGREQYWVYEMSDAGRESFGDFMARVKSTPITFDGCKLAYGNHQTGWNGELTVNGESINLQHKRFDTPYCVAERDAAEFLIAHGGHKLWLNFDKGIRELS